MALRIQPCSKSPLLVNTGIIQTEQSTQASGSTRQTLTFKRELGEEPDANKAPRTCRSAAFSSPRSQPATRLLSTCPSSKTPPRQKEAMTKQRVRCPIAEHSPGSSSPAGRTEIPCGGESSCGGGDGGGSGAAGPAAPPRPDGPSGGCRESPRRQHCGGDGGRAPSKPEMSSAKGAGF